MNDPRMLTYFDKYVSIGLKPIALYFGSKKPLEPKWNENWSILRWRQHFLAGKCNIGLLLGDIVDVEGDTDEANDLLERMIDGASRPMYRSSKSVHNLFLNPDRSLTRLVVDGIEFRADAHMSVAPPSEHLDGTKYKWLYGSKFPVPQMPAELADFFARNRRASDKTQKANRAGRKTHRPRTHCNKCGGMFPVHPRRLPIEVRAFAINNLLWMCRSCRPIDIRSDCRAVRRMR